MKTGYFEDQPGVKSSTRLMAFLSLLAGLSIALSSVFVESITLGDSLPMVITLLSYSAGVKTFQKLVSKSEK